MDTVTTARNEIEPLLAELIRQLHEEGRATQRAVFIRIHASLQNARTEVELARPFSALSTSASMGFDLSGDADVLLQRILEKTRQLSDAVPGKPGISH